MIKPFKRTITSIILAVTCSLIITGSVYGVNSDFIQLIKETERSAWVDINNNAVVDALQKLITLFRSAPENDIEIADALIGPLHLFSFITSEFYRPEGLYLQNLLQEKEYPSDKLLMAVAILSCPATRAMGNIRASEWLNELTHADNLTLKFLGEGLAVYLMTAEESIRMQKSMGSGAPAVMNALFINVVLENYPKSTVSQFVLQDLLNRGVEKVISEYGMYDAGKLVQTYIEAPERLNLLTEFNNTGIPPQKLHTHLSGFNKIAEVLPSMNLFDINEQVIRKWVEMLREEKDMNTRYALITFLKCGTILNKDCQELVKTALKEASMKKELTSDVLYAKITLLKLAMENFWLKEAEESLMDISQLEILPPLHGIKSSYAQQKTLMEKGAEYFVKLGYYDIAKKALELQLGRYRNSHFELGNRTKLKKLENYPFDYTLELINLDIGNSDMRRRPDLIRKYLDQIAQYTPNPDLKNLLANHDINKPLPYKSKIDYSAIVYESLQEKLLESIPHIQK